MRWDARWLRLHPQLLTRPTGLRPHAPPLAGRSTQRPRRPLLNCETSPTTIAPRHLRRVAPHRGQLVPNIGDLPPIRTSPSLSPDLPTAPPDHPCPLPAPTPPPLPPPPPPKTPPPPGGSPGPPPPPPTSPPPPRQSPPPQWGI